MPTKLLKKCETAQFPTTFLHHGEKLVQPVRVVSKKMRNFALADARMAESVDATVSNTVGATHPGSSPGPGTDNDC